MNNGDRIHLSLTLPGRRALARIAEIEALIVEEQVARAKAGDELAKLKASSCLDAKCCQSCEDALRSAIVRAIGARISVHADPHGVADDVIEEVKRGR